MTNNIVVNDGINIDPHWGVVPEGEAGRLLGSGSPDEVVSGAQLQKAQELND